MNFKIKPLDDFVSYEDSYEYLNSLLLEKFIPGYSGIPIELAVHINNILDYLERTTK